MSTALHQFSGWTTAFEHGLTNVYRGELRLRKIEYTPWLMEKKAKRWYQTDWEVTGVGQMPEKDIGAAISTDRIYQSDKKTFTLTAYALGLVIQYEAIRWDLYGVFPRLAKQLARSATDRYNIVGYGILNEAFNGSADTKYLTHKSEAICTSSHSRLDGGTWSNQLANNDGLTYEGIQNGCILMEKQVNERGRYIQMRAALLITSTDQKWIAKTILNTTLRPGTANNDTNTLDDMKIHTAVWLATPEHWWLKCPKNEGEFSIFMRLGDSPDLVRDNEVSTRNRHMSSYCSFDIAVMNSHGIVGSTGGA